MGHGVANNRNRKHQEADRRIPRTYAADSAAMLKSKLSDMYVKFFRWASDRLGDRDGIVRHYSDESITKRDIFHYIYALLHHPEYRERYAANLKRELPRIPFAPDFANFASAGRELARLHVEYESLDPWPLQEIETVGVPYSQHVEKMRLSADRHSLQVHQSLALKAIPPETFEYKLGSRSALEWVIDQYRVNGESDPNRDDDPGYIVRLVGQVVRASVTTVQIVKALPDFR